MKYANTFSSSTTSINASITSIPAATAASISSGSQFEELISKLFSCNIILMLTDQAKQYLKSCFGPTTTAATFANILNQFAAVNNLHSTIRDLNGHNAYALNKLRFRFFDVDQFKSRPNGAQLRKLHFDVISSMSNSYLNNATDGDDIDADIANGTPWYDLWRNIFIDTFEPSDHDFIGSSCGCFFVITKHELPHYKVIFERLCAAIKQNSSLRFIQSDFVRYFIVLSDQILEPTAASPDEYTKTCHSLKSEFPNSFILFIEPQQKEHQTHQTNRQSPCFTIGDGDSLNSDMSSLTMDDISGTNTKANITDPLNAAILEYPAQGAVTNSRFYNQLVNQRNEQLQKENSSGSSESGGGGAGGGSGTGGTPASTANSRDLFNDWLSSTQHHEHLKEICERISETIEFMLREFISKSLIPWAERQIKILGELIAQRKGFRKSIFSATKSLIGSMSSSTASLTKTLTGGGGVMGGGAQSGVIYIPDAQEMQQRKLADICMIFGVHEMAYNLYYSARKDFQAESAWLYFAGASEMTAIASYFIQKYHLNYFDQAITTYMDTCRLINLAARSTILATELFCQLDRHIDAANLFIRLTGDDSDLRSALFLEQASKCYLTFSANVLQRGNNNVPAAASATTSAAAAAAAVSAASSSSSLISTSSLQRSASTQSLIVAMSKSTSIESVGAFGSRYRKAAFHYILAGHRYNRCGLKHFSLMCYRRFNYPSWETASEHVNLTVGKLFLAIAANNRKKFSQYYLQGLKIFSAYAHKQVFFSELFRELKKYHTASGDASTSLPELSVEQANELYRLEIPFIHSCLFVSLDSLQPQEFSLKSRNQRHICFVGEQIEICFTISSPFPLSFSNIKLICAQPESLQFTDDYASNAITFVSADQVVELTLKLTALCATEFSLIGIEYEIDGVPFRRMFTERMQKSLNFKAIQSLPLISIEIAIPQLGLDVAAVNQAKHAQNSVIQIPRTVYGSEMITLKIALSVARPDWTPASIQLFTTAKQYYSWPSTAKMVTGETNGTAASASIAAVTNNDNDEDVDDDDDDDAVTRKEYPIPIQYGFHHPIDLPIHIPAKRSRHVVSIRLVYTDDRTKESRTILRKLSFNIEPCIDVEARFDSVITLKNLCASDPIAIFDVTIGEDEVVPEGAPVADPSDASYVSIPIGNSAHLLLLKSFIRWTLPITSTTADFAATSFPSGTLCRNGMILLN